MTTKKAELEARAYLAAAKRLYANPSNDDIEIDDYVIAEDMISKSEGEGGAFVKAWVWVTDDEANKEGN